MSMPPELGQINFNALPVWLIAIAVVLTLIPRSLKELSAFIPPLAAKFEADHEVKEAQLHHQLETEQISQSQQIKIQDKMLRILEELLGKMWDDRVETLQRLSEIRDELAHLSHVVSRNTDVTSTTVALMTEAAEKKRSDGQ